MTENDGNANERPSSKVANLIDEYDLDESFGDQLETLWTAEEPRRKSLRELATLFNRRLLKAKMSAAGMSTLDGEVDNIYRLLTEDDVSSGMQVEARKRLEQYDIDVDKLEADFVTYQAVRSYLKDYRDAEYVRDSESDRTEKVLETVQRLRSRLRAVTEENIDQLRDTGRITLGEYRLFIDIDVLCKDCGTNYNITDLLKRGGCDCNPE